MNATIRKARHGDELAIHDSHMRSIREVCIHDHGPEEIKGWGYREPRGDWLKDSNPNDHIWVVELDDKIEGHGFIRLEETQAKILSLYLTPVILGKGYGKQLMKLMLNTARDTELTAIVLDSSLTAQSFYKSFGFVDSGPLRKVAIAGHLVSSIPMHYSLDRE